AAAVGEGRYTLYALPLLAIVLVLGVDRHVTRALLLCAATVLTIATLPSAASSGAPMSPDAKEPPAIGPLVDALDDAGVDHVWASYHTAYRIAFHSDERIVAAAHVAGRWLPYQHDVAADERPAWVFPAASPQGGDFGRGLDALHERYDTITVPGFVAYWPHERVVAARVLAAGQLDGRRRTVDP
ncbi:MAG TPA: hypothetical protein VEA78_12590, partial [Acidimicrobiales bacterium]|nr:hypothetical protein [Acidimicrobiales bacterium]